MSFHRYGSRRAALIVALLALVVASGCGGDDDENENSASSGGESEQAKQPASLPITATGSEKALVFEVAATAPAGAVSIEFRNDTKDEVDAQLVRVDGDHPAADVLAQLRGATQGKPVADWFHAAGGAGEAKPGASATVVQELKPGTHYVVGGERGPKGEPAKFEVSAGDGAPMPDADARVIATDYAFAGEGLTAGPSKVLLANDGKQWHHFIASRLKPGATLEEAKKFFETEEGEPPFAGGDNEVSSTVLDGGESQLVDLDLEAGKYAFLCFVSDREGGPPHVVKGMISEVTVE